MCAHISGWLVKYDLPGHNNLRFAPGCFHLSDNKFVPLIDDSVKSGPDFIASQIVGYAAIHEKEEGVWCDVYINDTCHAKAYLRKLKFVQPKSFTFEANRIKKQQLRTREKILQGSIISVGISAVEIPTSTIESIHIEREKKNNEYTGTESGMEGTDEQVPGFLLQSGGDSEGDAYDCTEQE